TGDSPRHERCNRYRKRVLFEVPFNIRGFKVRTPTFDHLCRVMADRAHSSDAPSKMDQPRASDAAGPYSYSRLLTMDRRFVAAVKRAMSEERRQSIPLPTPQRHSCL